MPPPMTQPTYEVRDRRPMKPRDWASMQRLTDLCIALHLTPNAISVMSVLFSLLSASAMVGTTLAMGFIERLLWVIAAMGIELRALCNLLDGMVAVKTRTASPVGELYNEVPDRLSDIAMFVGLGLATHTPALGLLTACAAVTVAYVRAQAASAGAGQDYTGPMAKPARMQLVALGCVAMSMLPVDWRGPWFTLPAMPPTTDALPLGLLEALLLLITLGCVLTLIRRLRRASQRLREKHA